MLFLVSLLLAGLFPVVAGNSLRKHSVFWYIISVLVSAGVAAVRFTGMTAPFFNTWIFSLFDRAVFSTALFVIVMYTGAFRQGSFLFRKFMPVRGQLSIIASILTLGHNTAYGRTYFAALFSGRGGLPVPYILAAVCSLIMIAIMLPLFVTSFICVRRRMDGKSWKRLQRLAYVFYALIYTHVVLVNISGAAMGVWWNILNIGVYTFIFSGYLLCRLLKAFNAGNRGTRLDTLQFGAMAVALCLGVGCSLLLNSMSGSVATDSALPETVAQEGAASCNDGVCSAADGVYSATAFGYEGDISVSILVKDGVISEIYLDNYEDNPDYHIFAGRMLDRIRANPLGRADLISGATFTTGAVRNAYSLALAKAMESTTENRSDGRPLIGN